jgi:hypothetical protein
VHIGSREYVHSTLSTKADELAGKADNMIQSLGSSSKQSLWVLVRCSFQHRFSYFVSNSYLSDSAGAAAAFDSAVLRLATVALGVSVGADAHACRRLLLPVSSHGGGLRRQADSAHAEVWGAAWQVVPHLLDTLAPDGTVLVQGILDRPAIAARVGRGALGDMATQGWRSFFGSGSRLGAELEAAWGHMQGELGQWALRQDGEAVRVLHLPAGSAAPAAPDAGRKPNLQADITGDRERCRLAMLDAEHAAMPPSARARQLWFAVGRESGLFLSLLPRGLGAFSCSEWVEATARYFGLPSPACAPLAAAGARLPRSGAQRPVCVDAYGDSLTAAPGVEHDHFAKLRHDPVLAALASCARMAGAYVRLEDGDVFGSVLAGVPAAGRRALGRRRVPTVDLVVALAGQQTLFELKTLAFCQTRYKPWGDGRRCGAVELRAREVPRERLRDCVALDREIFGTPEGQVGPMQRRLNEFPPLRAVVVGSFGEWSAGLADLLKALSHMGADAWMARMRAPTRPAAQASLERVMRHHLAACVVRGHAQLLLARARMVRDGAAPRRAAEQAAQAGADACGGLDGVYRLHAGGGTRPETRAG